MHYAEGRLLSPLIVQVARHNAGGRTPAFVAAFEGNVGALEVLIDFKADVKIALPVRLIILRKVTNRFKKNYFYVFLFIVSP